MPRKNLLSQALDQVNSKETPVGWKMVSYLEDRSDIAQTWFYEVVADAVWGCEKAPATTSRCPLCGFETRVKVLGVSRIVRRLVNEAALEGVDITDYIDQISVSDASYEVLHHKDLLDALFAGVREVEAERLMEAGYQNGLAEENAADIRKWAAKKASMDDPRVQALNREAEEAQANLKSFLDSEGLFT